MPFMQFNDTIHVNNVFLSIIIWLSIIQQLFNLRLWIVTFNSINLRLRTIHNETPQYYIRHIFWEICYV